MGAYINKGNAGFAKYAKSDYVDKTGMIAYINSTLGTASMLTCVTRPRRFGKSMAANMLYAYYDKSCDSRTLFEGLEISKDATFNTHLNKYPTIFLDMTRFTTKYEGHEDIMEILQNKLVDDIRKAYPDVDYDSDDDLMDVLLAVHNATDEQFIFIIDEWDALCREFADNPKLMEDYVKLLRRLFKTDDTAAVFAGVYMTGILPVKKYGTQSALNDFWEYSMVCAGALAPYFGFLPEEIKRLCEKKDMDYELLRQWYDGYELEAVDWRNEKSKPETINIYNPNSVIKALSFRTCENYWAKTESFESLRQYIEYDFAGVKETLQSLLDGKPATISTLSFGNDQNNIASSDELFTLMVHLGYVSYNSADHTISLPNLEVKMEILEAIRTNTRHTELAALVAASDNLLKATLRMDAEAVAQGVGYVHNHRIAPQFYNNEQALRSVIKMAYITAIDDYQEIQELPSGKGYADLVFLPRPRSSKPVIVIELKWNESAQTAIDQIKNREYAESLQSFAGEILLVGINYDPTAASGKAHTCTIERTQR